MTFDPEQRLPEAPDPWASSAMPAIRSGPPFAMTEMIAAEPAFTERLVRRLADERNGTARLAEAIRDTVVAGLPLVVTGCGTSEHGAMAIAESVAEAMRRSGLPGTPVAEQAFELSLDPPRGGLVIAVSHEGGTRMTNTALEAARAAGARTAIVTVSDRSPGATLADIVVLTGEQDQSWCHTVGYLSPILAGASIAAQLTGERLDGRRVRDVVAGGSQELPSIEAVAARFVDRRPILVVASGADRIAARELALKLEEGTHLTAIYRDLETVLHGHLAGTDRSTGLVLIFTERRARSERGSRARGVLAAAAAIGIATAAIVSQEVSAELPSDLTPAGRIVVPDARDMPAPAASLLASATALQLLTERLARLRRVNPDSIRRDNPAYLAAADVAERDQ